jgi:serine/threonine protein kinase
MKVINKSIIWDKKGDNKRPLTLEAEHKIKEIEVMLNLHNPYCIHLHEIIESPKDHIIYIVMHLYPNGTLQDQIDSANLAVKDLPSESAALSYRK